MEFSFFKGKKVFLTGHTGFKGTWLSRILLMAGAEVTGYALAPPAKSNLFELTRTGQEMKTVAGDIRDLDYLKKKFSEVRPEIVIHLAAQPIVRESYKNPRGTYETNVMGTVNICECVKNSETVRSFLNVTTDKVYRNNEWEWGYRETDPLEGYDPYSNSKSCSELVTHCYENSFLSKQGIAVSTARAGNVIGGGDFSVDRIIPDCVRAAECENEIIIRNPFSIRPYQHVLDPLMAYLMIVQTQYGNREYAGSYNVGPQDSDCLTTGELVTLFCNTWKEQTGNEIKWTTRYDEGPHEAGFLKLDCSRIRKVFAWNPVWPITKGMEKVVEWTDCYLRGGDVNQCMEKQIREFLSDQTA